MPVAQVQLAPAALIVGCGFVGRALAALLVARGVDVSGIVRSDASAASLEKLGVTPLVTSITDPIMLRLATRFIRERDRLDVYFLVPPGRPREDGTGTMPRETLIEGTRHIQSTLTPARVRRVVVTSSTAVFGQSSGERVDADSAAVPSDERGQLLLDAENVSRESAFDSHIVRLAGLYGPGRIIGLQAVRDGAPLIGDPDAWLNLIHVDDAAELLLAVMSAASPGDIELGSDGSPVKRIEYYTTLAKCIGASPPRVLDAGAAAAQLGIQRERLQRASSKQCDNVLTCQRTGWLPRYPHFRDGLIASFAAMRK